MIFPFGDVHEVDAMISEADSAMYQSKLSGGHTYTFYERRDWAR
jgi:GGDEF domain-containing protein